MGPHTSLWIRVGSVGLRALIGECIEKKKGVA
jgi:hypothetical protein